LTLVAAFTLSVVHTGYAWRAGLEDPDFTVDTPLTWVFYAVGFTAAALARRSSRRIELALVGYLTAMLAIGVFYYPTTFTSEKQTTFGWFENDVYLALLGLALFLSVTRLLQRPLVP
jgi:predicted Kef-type K+ transport protein